MTALPATIGRFRILEVLGQGAMGIVYKAHDPDIDRLVAIKLVRADLLSDSDDHAARFRNEAKIVGRFVHPNIVGIHDFSTHEGAPFLVLEFVEGRDLGKLRGRHTQVSLPQVAGIVLQVTDALEYAHRHGVIHRDIKPANIMVTTAGSVKVTDFGISRALAADATRSSVLVGTPSYMSPEQCRGDALDARSDLFSLGCVFYELLSGRRGFAAENFVATTHKVLHEHPVPLSELRPDLPDAIASLVERALAKRPEDRFASAAAMGEALRVALRSRGPSGGPSGGEDPDATTVLPIALATARDTAELELLDARSLGSIERSLAHHVGPMARFHLQRALRDSASTEEFTDRLVALVPDASQGEMRRAIAAVVRADDAVALLRSQGTAPSIAASVSAEAIAGITRALAEVVGPIARQFVQRALKEARGTEAVIESCAARIDDPGEREMFRGKASRWL